VGEVTADSGASGLGFFRFLPVLASAGRFESFPGFTAPKDASGALVVFCFFPAIAYPLLFGKIIPSR
jgi:hypothetical protein